MPNNPEAIENAKNDFGTPPKRSRRVATVAAVPEQDSGNAVKIATSFKQLYYVASIEEIDEGELSAVETVDAWTLENEHLKVTGVLLGGNLMGFQDLDTDDEAKKEYLWLNTPGAVGYGPNSNAFPLTRGLFLHGGIRMAAVSAEHGLYYDTDWDLDFEISESGDEGSLIFTIQDTQQARDELEDPLSTGGFSSWSPEPMKNYPVTDAKFIFKVTLKAGEKFLRTECTVDNTKDEVIQGEAWMPQTWPVGETSQIISHQKKRRIKGGNAAYVADGWVMNALVNGKYVATDMHLDPDKNLPQYNGTKPYTTKTKEGPKDGWIVPFPPASMGPTEEMKWKHDINGDVVYLYDENGNVVTDEHGAKVKQVFLAEQYWGQMDLNYPLQWPSGDGGIMYDYPFMDGNYHAVSFGDGTDRGVAYVAKESTAHKPHFTKMWSWGNKRLFVRSDAIRKDPPLAAGRPKTEYYEPWASAFNTAFFELYQFPPGPSSWEARFVPITQGLGDKKQHELRDVVDEAVKDAVKSLD